jgi:hypothetical protein
MSNEAAGWRNFAPARTADFISQSNFSARGISAEISRLGSTAKSRLADSAQV